MQSSLDKADEENNERLVRIEGLVVQDLPDRDIAAGNMARTLTALTQLRSLSKSPKVEALATELATHLRKSIAKAQQAFVESYRPTLRKALIDGLKGEKTEDVDKPLAAALGLKRTMALFVDAEGNELELVDSDEVDMVVNILSPWQIGLRIAKADAAEPQTLATMVERIEQAYNEDLSEIVPRSEVLGLLDAARRRWNLPAMLKTEHAQIIEKARVTLGRVSKLEELPHAIAALNDLAPTWRPGAILPINPIAELVTSLHALQRSYLEIKAGTASVLPGSPQYSKTSAALPFAGNSIDALLFQGNSATEESKAMRVPFALAAEFGAIHELTLRFALPRVLGNAEAPGEAENIPAYLARLTETAVKEKNWARLAKILAAVEHLKAADVLSSGDILALRFVLSGSNLERGRQYPAAVAAYLAALKSGSQAVPAEWIGGQLEAIQKAHPEAYEAGQHVVAELPVQSAKAKTESATEKP